MRIGTIASLTEIERAFEHCEEIARRHYENFPVASLFLPRVLRPHVSCIYAFARTADDFSDEGSWGPEERLQKLDEWGARLHDCYAGKVQDSIFLALADTVRRYGIPRQPLADLLDAFRADVTKNRFPTFSEVLEYCKKSANPVGRLILYLFKNANDRTFELSDSICTALQLANFWQDVAVDMAKGRIYIPLEDLDRFGYTESDLLERKVDDRFRSMMEFEVCRTREIFARGKPLLREATPRLRFELELTYRGGIAILDMISSAKFGYDVLTRRPALSSPDKAVLLIKALMRTQV